MLLPAEQRQTLRRRTLDRSVATILDAIPQFADIVDRTLAPSRKKRPKSDAMRPAVHEPRSQLRNAIETAEKDAKLQSADLVEGILRAEDLGLADVRSCTRPSYRRGLMQT
jgi:hypothetical protein